MARKPNPESPAFLRRQVAELVAVNGALAAKLAAFIDDHEATIEGVTKAAAEQGEHIAELVADRDRYQELWRSERRKLDAANEDRKRYEIERDEARAGLQSTQWTLTGVERERDAARAIADGMRQQAYPQGPQFPWEKLPPTLERLQEYDPATRMRRPYGR